MADLNPASSTLSANFAPYVYDMLSRGQGLASLPFQEYTGERFTGPSALQSQAFQGLAGLSGAPSQFGTATQFATQAGQAAGGMGYTPSGGPTYGQINTGLGAVGSVQDYMNPYMTGVTDIASRKARQEADIARRNLNAKFAGAGGAGAFSAMGGGRHAVESALLEQAAQQQLSDIQEKGLQSAYDRALQQRMQEAQLGVTAQQANQQSALEAGRQAEQSRQFGAGFGLQGLQQQLGAAQTLGSLGAQQQQAGLQGLQAQLGAGETQRQIAQQPLDFGYQQFQESLQDPYKKTTFMQSLLQGMPLKAPDYSAGTSGLMSALQGGLSGLALYNLFNKQP